MTCSVEAAIDPTSKLTFLLDWELTLKCNYDCSYCTTGLYGGHDNSTKHPPVSECLDTIDFMYKYADLHMSNKKNSLKHVILNVYGGEALYHPDIVEILSKVREKHRSYQDKWSLTVSTTTNLSLSNKTLLAIAPYVDEWTCSYHSESTDKQKNQFKSNLLTLKTLNKSFKVVNLIHNDSGLFNDCLLLEDWCQSNNIKILNRQLDDGDFSADKQRLYKQNQVTWFKQYYSSRNRNNPTQDIDYSLDLANTGRSCCGGRLLSVDQNYKNSVSYIENRFPGWTCGVNHFFVYVKQVTKEVFNNKDCKINYDNELGPIGTLDDTESIIKKTTEFLNKGDNAGITCIKNKCFCGLCAPKAENLIRYNSVIKKYLKINTL